MKIPAKADNPDRQHPSVDGNFLWDGTAWHPVIVTPPADWYRDPLNRHEYRYWDGMQWTHHVADRGQASVEPDSQG